MNTKKITLFGFIALLLGSCVNYLEPYPQGNKDSENIWQYSENIQGLIGWCYDNMNSNRNYNDNEGTYLDGATDDAVITSSTNNIHRLAVNALTTGNDPFLTYWERDYRAIRNVNFFLEGRRGYNTRFVIEPHFNDLVKNRLQGEAFAIRAWHQWDLLQKFGGEGASSHQMLGFPIVTEVVGLDENMNLRRNTYDECVAQILADCDSAYKYLPIAHRDFLVPSADRSYAGGKYWGRFDGITMRALKAMVYLTWASPRFNPGNAHAERWDSAAYNARKVIEFKLTVDIYNRPSGGGSNAFNPTKPVIWTNPNFGGIVMTSRYNTGNDAMEKMFYPGGFQGNGVIGATQELVDAFPDKNGRPITDPLTVYNAANPYANRDPRFYSAIFYNGGKANRDNNVTKPMYTFETWAEGPNGPGKDAAGVAQNNSLTNYHIKKFVAMTVNWNDLNVSRQPHSKFFIRWDHMILAFAEAANHVTHNPNTSLYGLSPKAALAYLRTRPSYDNVALGFGTDPYLTATANAGEAAFDALVKNERRIELCFEGTRFFDLRRWTTDADWQSVINKPVHGALIKQNADLSFTYDLVNYEVEKRAFQSPYLPIPYQEILRVKDLEQNVGWETWN
jgi:hypothetical protein